MGTGEGPTEGHRPALKASQRLLAVKKKLVAQPPPQQRNELTGTGPADATAHNASGAAAAYPNVAASISTGPNAAGCAATVSVSGMVMGSFTGPSVPRRTGKGTVTAASAASLSGAVGEATERTAPALGLATSANAGGAAPSTFNVPPCGLPAADGSRIACRLVAGDAAAADAVAAPGAAVPAATDAASAGQVAGSDDGAPAASHGLIPGTHVAPAAIGAAQSGELLSRQTGHAGAAAVATGAATEAELRSGAEQGAPVVAAAVASGPVPGVSGQANTTSASCGGGSAARNIRSFSAKIKVQAKMLKDNALFISSVLAKKCGFDCPEDMVPREGFTILLGQLQFDHCTLRRVRCNAIESGPTCKHDAVKWVAGLSCPRDSWLKEAGLHLNDVVRFQLKDGVYTLERIETALASGSAAPAASDAAPAAAAADSAGIVHEKNKTNRGTTSEAHRLAATAGPASGAGCLEMEGSGAFLTQVGSCEPGGVAVAQERESNETAGAVSTVDSGVLNDSRRGACPSAVPDDVTRAVSGVYVGDLQTDAATGAGAMEVGTVPGDPGPSGAAAGVPSMQPDSAQAVVKAISLFASASNPATRSADPPMTAVAAGAYGPVTPAPAEVVTGGAAPAAKKPKRPSPIKAVSVKTKPLGQGTVPAKKAAKTAAGSSGEVPVAKPSVSPAADAAAAAPVAIAPPAKRPRLCHSQEMGAAVTPSGQNSPPKHVGASDALRPVPGSRLEVNTAINLPQGAEEDKAGGVKSDAGIGQTSRVHAGCAKRLSNTDVGRDFQIPASMICEDGIFAKLHKEMAFVKHTVRFVNATDPSQSWKVTPTWRRTCARMGLVSAFQALDAQPNDMVVFGAPDGQYPGHDDGIPTFTIAVKQTNPLPLDDEPAGEDTTTATVPASTNPAQPPDASTAARYAVAGLSQERLRGNCFWPATVLPGQGIPVAGTADLCPSSDAEAELKLCGVTFPCGAKAAVARAAASSWRERRRHGGAAAAPLLQIPGLGNDGRRLPGCPHRQWHGLFLPPKPTAPDSPTSGGARRAALKAPDILSSFQAMLDRQRRELLAERPGNGQQRREGTVGDDDPNVNDEDLVLPAGPVHLAGLRPCLDEARGGLGVCVIEELPPGAAVGVLGGMVLQGHRGSFWDREKGGRVLVLRPEGQSEAEEYAQEGYQWLDDEAAREEMRRRGPGGNVHLAWKYLAMSYQMPYPDELAERVEGSSGDGGASLVSPKPTVQSSPHVLCMLGHGNVLALLNDGRKIDLNDAKGDGGQPRGNCTVIPLLVHGVVLPLVVTICNVRAGAQLVSNYGTQWWQQLAGPWEMALFEDLDIKRILHGDVEDLAGALLPGPAAAPPPAGRVAPAAEVRVVVGATKVSEEPGTTAAGGATKPSPTAPPPAVAEPAADQGRQQAGQASCSTQPRKSSMQARSSMPGQEAPCMRGSNVGEPCQDRGRGKERPDTKDRDSDRGRDRDRDNDSKASERNSGRRSHSRKRSRSSSGHRGRARTPTRRSRKRSQSRSCPRDNARQRGRSLSRPRPGAQEPAARRQERCRSQERDFAREIDRGGHRERQRERDSDRDRERGWERQGSRDVERGPEPQRQPASPRPAGTSTSGLIGKQGTYAPPTGRGEAGPGAGAAPHQRPPPLRTLPKEHPPSGMPPAASQAAFKSSQAAGPAAARPATAGPTSITTAPAASTEAHRKRTRSRSRERPKPPGVFTSAPHMGLGARGQFTSSWRAPAPPCAAQPFVRPLPLQRGHSAQPQPEQLPPQELLGVMPVLDDHLDAGEVQRCMASLDRPLADELRVYFAPWLRMLG